MAKEIWAIVSNLHCGSTLGLCPPEGIQLDDGGWYTPSIEQKELWLKWEEYWDLVKAEVKKGDRLFIALNGDIFDGDHHGTAQIVTKNLASVQHEIALATLKPALALSHHGIVVIRGTEAHVGASGAYEERLARDLEAVPNPVNGTRSHWHFQADSNGTIIDFAHHGSVGKLPHTRSNPAKTLAMKITQAAVRYGIAIPDLAIRSHAHQEADTYDDFPVRVIQTRGWQLSTAFVHRIAAGSLPEIGCLIVSCDPGSYQVKKVKWNWKRAPLWKYGAKSTSPKTT